MYLESSILYNSIIECFQKSQKIILDRAATDLQSSFIYLFNILVNLAMLSDTILSFRDIVINDGYSVYFHQPYVLKTETDIKYQQNYMIMYKVLESILEELMETSARKW